MDCGFWLFGLFLGRGCCGVDLVTFYFVLDYSLMVVVGWVRAAVCLRCVLLVGWLVCRDSDWFVCLLLYWLIVLFYLQRICLFWGLCDL